MMSITIKRLGVADTSRARSTAAYYPPVAKTNLKGFRSRQVGYEPLQGCDGNDELKRHWC